MTEIITVTGNLTADPEQRSLGNGTSVTSFRVAAEHRRYDRDKGQWITQYTNFYSVSAFRALGAHAYASLRKGHRVVVTGRLHLRSWDNGTKTGISADIEADAVGHDLLFGTTSYAPDDRERGALRATTPQTEEAGGDRDADGWSLPGSPALVGAGTAGADAAADDTPF